MISTCTDNFAMSMVQQIKFVVNFPTALKIICFARLCIVSMAVVRAGHRKFKLNSAKLQDVFRNSKFASLQ